MGALRGNAKVLLVAVIHNMEESSLQWKKMTTGEAKVNRKTKEGLLGKIDCFVHLSLKLSCTFLKLET